jgi:hypothetical protein
MTMKLRGLIGSAIAAWAIMTCLPFSTVPDLAIATQVSVVSDVATPKSVKPKASLESTIPVVIAYQTGGSGRGR